MNRRIFLTWLGLGFLASSSLSAIAAIINQDKHNLASNSSSKGLKAVSFYVAPNGNDSWTGKRKNPNSAKNDGPFATLHRARDAIRELKRQQGGTLQQPVTVFLRDGTYFLSEPLIFTPEDSGTADFPVTYKAYRKEKPVISGGKRITAWKQKGNLWVANLPEVKTGKWYFRLLRVGEDWAIRARYPNFEPKNALKGGWLYVNRAPLEQGNFNSNVGRIHNRGDKIQWNIFVPATGKYKFWLRYSNNMKAYGVDNMGGRTTIKVGNNNPVPLRNLPDTGSFSTFRWQLVSDIDLSAGEQKLVWENIKGGGLGLDAFCLTDDPDWNPVTAITILKGESEAQVQQPQRGKHLIFVHAETFERAEGRDLAIFPEPQFRDRITISPAKFPNWQNWDGAEVNLFMKHNYGNSIFPVDSADKENHKLLGNFSNRNYPLAFGNRFFIENVREALDSPGEWYLDIKTGELFYLPTAPDFPNNVDVVAPTIDKLIVLQGNRELSTFVEYINFQGLTFTDTNYTLADNYFVPADAAIWLSTSRQCGIKNCNFVRLGGYGVRMEQRSQENRIIKNTMAQLGQGGVVLLGDKATQPFNNLIAANDIHDCGKVYKHVAGVYVTSGSDNRIAHNRIYRMPRYGISLKSVNSNHYSHNNIVEYNEIVDTNLETADTGAIETLGRDKQLSGNIIRFNFIRNVVGMGTTASGEIISPYFSWGIYLDDYSSGTTVYGNIIVGTVRGAIMIRAGKNNLVENNIFVDGAESQIQLASIENFVTRGNIIRRNICVYKEPKAKLLHSYAKTWQRDFMTECDFNLYWQEEGLDLAKTERVLTPEGNFAQWQAAGFDRNSMIADPLFVAPEEGDFRLQFDSPAFRLGFQRIPTELIGIRGFKW